MIDLTFRNFGGALDKRTDRVIEHVGSCRKAGGAGTANDLVRESAEEYLVFRRMCLRVWREVGAVLAAADGRRGQVE
jgi:hypothetical protein